MLQILGRIWPRNITYDILITFNFCLWNGFLGSVAASIHDFVGVWLKTCVWLKTLIHEMSAAR